MTGVDASATPLLRDLDSVVPGVTRTDRIRRRAMAHDASHFLLEPLAVATPRTVQEVAALLTGAGAHGIGVTFRSGGTSLSGQAATDGLMLDVRRGFRGIEVLDDGARVRAQPGATLRAVNTRLARYGRKLGPDPASEIACTIGGVIANNSSGMSCGTEFNAYRTLESVVLALPSGTILDTAAPDAADLLASREPRLHDALLELRDRVRTDAASVAEIRRQFAMKNTMGYAINAFLDHDDPLAIMQHLVVGSEGTLAFVASAVFRTVPRAVHAATALLVFPTLADAVTAVRPLAAFGVAAIELMDATTLRVAQLDASAPAGLRGLDIDEHAALLIELEGSERPAFDALVHGLDALAAGLPLVVPGRATEDAVERSSLWHTRKGLYATVAGNRPTGTTALLEDVAVPGERLLALCNGLGPLLAEHGYEGGVLFGHAKDGNVHFMLNERFDRPRELLRYETFTEDLVELVLGLGGTLKAEHGTGRMMAPYVRRQYGDTLYGVMRDVKQAFDPSSLLNPGAVMSSDPRIHLQHLKVVPAVEPEVTRCVECGFCEPVCPSRDLTLTPRQRIALRRDVATALAMGDTATVEALGDGLAFDAIDTCAVDGMCSTACPLHINTGDLVRTLRVDEAPAPARIAWALAAGQWARATRIAANALDLAATIPAVAVAASGIARRLLGDDTVPQWAPDLPRGGSPRRSLAHPEPDAVLFPSCTGSMFASEGIGVDAAVRALCERADVGLRTPDDVNALCCATPWKSKGLRDGYARMQALVAGRLWKATGEGRLPVVCDSSSCTEGLQVLLAELAASGRVITIIDAVQFVADTVLPKLTLHEPMDSIALHPTCASVQMGSDAALRRIGESVAREVVVPDAWACCGFAGDRGMLHPELTASATRAEAAEVNSREFSAHASSNRTCEIGMARATGRPYRHILEILAEQCA